MSSQARQANVDLDLAGKTAVVAGGSQGIGAAVALRFAKAGANVIVIGRSKERLEKVVAEARKVAKSPDQKFDYVSADLSLVSGTKAAAKEIEAKTNSNVDYLLQSQGGMPNGLHQVTSEGIETQFAVQDLSRFTLNYILASSGTLKNTSINVMATGGNQKEFNLDEMDLANQKGLGTYSRLGKQIARDGVVVDTYTKALQRKFPKINFFHVSPGIVQTDVMTNNGVPLPLKLAITYIVYPIAIWTFGNTPDSYADIPVFLAANEDRESVIVKEGFFLSNKNKKISPHPYAMVEKNQEAMFEKLKWYMDGH
jgi:NAD(P)-dependent dehydrogenase (short-subunit alcohol dehydrogenase family)